MKNVLLGFEVDNYAARSTLAGILKFASAHGAWELRIATVPDPLTADMIRHAPSEGFDGIIANGVVDDAAISALAKTPLPVCLVESADEFIPKRRRAIARACNDNRKIGALGAKHLLDLGRFSSYAFAPHPDAPPWSENRRKGFVEELARHGIQAEILTGDIADGLSLLAKPAAVMAAWDYKAIEIVRCARNAGLRIPEHVAVIGVDSDPLICDFTNPPLTSVAPDFEGLGFAAAEALESMMSGDGRKSTVRVCHPPKGVVKRGSSQYLPTGRSLIERAKSIITREAANGLTVRTLATRLNASPQILALRFRQFGNITPRELILQTRLEKVKSLLTSSSSKLDDVATQCGFSSARRLSYLFKARFGTTMRDYRAQKRFSN